jgi:hypothetical protein
MQQSKQILLKNEHDMILNYKYLVLTCINSNLLIVKENISELLSSITKFPVNWDVSQINLNFTDIYFPEPQKGGAHLMKFIIWEPSNNPGTTVFFINYEDGWNSLIELYSKRFSQLCVQICLSADDLSYPFFKFAYYNSDRQRVLLCYKDINKWEFFQKGQTLSFENPVYYKKRRIKDRLPNDLIYKYMEELGWNIFDERFWITNKPVFNFKRIKWDQK